MSTEAQVMEGEVLEDKDGEGIMEHDVLQIDSVNFSLTAERGWTVDSDIRKQNGRLLKKKNVMEMEGSIITSPSPKFSISMI